MQETVMKIGAKGALLQFERSLSDALKRADDSVYVPRWAAEDARALLKVATRQDDGEGMAVFVRLRNGQTEDPDGKRVHSRPFVLSEAQTANHILVAAQKASLTEEETIAVLHKAYVDLQAEYSRHLQESAKPAVFFLSGSKSGQ
jgi:hypothetical protein